VAVTIFFNIHTTRWLGVRVKQSLQNALIAFLSTASLGWTRKYHVVEKSCLQSFSWTKELWPYAFRQWMYMRLLKSSFQTSELDFVTCHVSPRFVNESTYEMQICIFMYVKKMPVVEYKKKTTACLRAVNSKLEENCFLDSNTAAVAYTLVKTLTGFAKTIFSIWAKKEKHKHTANINRDFYSRTTEPQLQFLHFWRKRNSQGTI